MQPVKPPAGNAVRGMLTRESRKLAAHKVEPGTFANVIREYIVSPAFKKLSASTKRNYSESLYIAEKALGHIAIETIRPALVQVHLDALADKPGRQRISRTALKAVERFAVVRDLVPYPFTTGTYAEQSEDGHEPWTFEQVEIAEANASAPISRVITMMFHLGQRRSDIIRMRWSDIEEKDGLQGIAVVQKKTGVRLWVPFTAELVGKIATWERKPPFFLALDYAGKQWSDNNLSVAWYRERSHKPALAPLSGLRLHGLRATAIVRARMSGASILEISSMFGMSPPMVTRYTRLADKADMAVAAVHRLDRTAQERKEKDKAKGFK